MSKLNPPVGPKDHVRGSPDALVTLVEYGDFECPYCGRAHLALQEVERRMGRDMRFVFRHFPLAELHPHAVAAAEAAEAAGAQRKFWPMHDMLYENQGALEIEDLVGYANALGLDTEQFSGDLVSHAHLDRCSAISNPACAAASRARRRSSSTTCATRTAGIPTRSPSR